MQSKRKGMYLEAKIMADLLKCGCAVMTPWGDTERYDLVMEINRRLYRIQVKTSRTRNGGRSFEFDCRSTQGRTRHLHYDKGQIDYFATAFNGQSYMVPIEECRAAKLLRLAPPGNHQNTRINYAADYELEKVVRRLKEENDGEADSL